MRNFHCAEAGPDPTAPQRLHPDPEGNAPYATGLLPGSPVTDVLTLLVGMAGVNSPFFATGGASEDEHDATGPYEAAPRLGAAVSAPPRGEPER